MGFLPSAYECRKWQPPSGSEITTKGRKERRSFAASQRGEVSTMKGRGKITSRRLGTTSLAEAKGSELIRKEEEIGKVRAWGRPEPKREPKGEERIEP